MTPLQFKLIGVYPGASYAGIVGCLPFIFSEDDPQSAKEQANLNYAHGGGWNPFEGFNFIKDTTVENWRLEYPGDPPMRALAYARLRDEMIILFQHSWVAIVQQDGSHEIARMD